MSVSLRSISDPEILSRTHTLAAQERRITLRFLMHLNEVERRRLFLRSGYRSMFDYCTSCLRLSEPAAARRIRTARCLARFPELHVMLESGDVNLTTVSMVAKHLTPGNAADVLARIRGRSRRDVERVVAEMEPRAALPPDRVRPVVVPVSRGAALSPATVNQREAVQREAFMQGTPATQPAPRAAAPRSTVASDSEPARSASMRSVYTNQPSDPSKSAATPILERCALIQFAASEDFLELVERVRSIASHRLPPNATFEQVFALVMNEYVKREDPQMRHERRESRKGAVQEAVQQRDAPADECHPRRIPAAVRDRVHARDRGRCAYVAPGGRRCGSTRHLQVDHIYPVARGGGAGMDNLRLLCAHHTRLEAERLMGRAGPPDG